MTDATFDLSSSIGQPATGQAQERVIQILLWVTIGFAAVLGAGLVAQMFAETGGTNSYAALAEAFLSGRLDIIHCFDIDCASFDGKQYVVFPPGPAVLAMPFVALFGVNFAGFVALTTALTAGTLFVWWRIFTVLRVERQTAIWLLLALGLGTPLYYVTIRGDGVWFMAQAAAFLAMTLAIWAVLEKRSLFLAGAFVGFAFLSRQMTVLVLPFLFVLALPPGQRLFSFSRINVATALKLGAPVLAAIAIYMVYNYARFGGVLDTGYDYIATPESEQTFISHRTLDIGLFSGEYFLSNIFYFLFQGFHVDFVGPYLTELGDLDRLGSSLLAASPFVLLAVFVPWRRPIVIGALCALAMIVPMLVYHSNGFTQFNGQRYVLDWAPILFFALALTIKRGLRPAFAVLVTYAVGLNVVTSVVAYFSHA